MIILDGKTIANEISSDIKETLKKISGRPPCLSVIVVGHNPASHIYVTRKTKECAHVGILSIRKDFPSTVTQAELLDQIQAYNIDPNIDGILVQLPLPSHINSTQVMLAVDPNKDVDGFHPVNMGKLLTSDLNAYVPCTALGIHYLLQRYKIPVEGKHVVIIGRSNIVGRPLAALFLQNAPGCNATVTVAHRFTSNLKEICLTADILITAIGQPRLITEDMVKSGVVIVDVGINRIDDPTNQREYILVGDVDFENVRKKSSYITPVPGGVGPLTISMLLKNTLRSYQTRKSQKLIS